MMLLKKRKIMILITLHILTAIKKAIIPVIAISQKTSIGFDNLYTGN